MDHIEPFRAGTHWRGPEAQRFHAENREGLAEWNIRPDFWAGRTSGLSAYVRLKNEAARVLPSLDSIATWVDEIVVLLHGAQEDGTDELVRAWAAGRAGRAPAVHVYTYPFDTVPLGPGHDAQPRGSVHELAYMYNWGLAKTTRSHVMKWDGDMVAFDWLGAELRRLMDAGVDPIRFAGWNLATLSRLARGQRTANEVRVFRVSEATYWFSGHYCEMMPWTAEPDGREHVHGHDLGREAYLHFKWVDSAGAPKGWPADWRAHPELAKRHSRGAPGLPYRGEWPSALAECSELDFWRRWIDTRGGRWGGDFRRRFDERSPLAEEIARHAPPGDGPLAVLDVGAGPVTSIGYTLPGRVVKITAIDPLAAAYARLLEVRGLVPPVATIEASAEGLAEHFGEQRFDVVHARNALDHSADPVAGIRAMLAVTRLGGAVVLRHHANEGERGAYEGLHRWNFELRAGAQGEPDVALWNRAETVMLSSLVPAGARLEARPVDGDVEVEIVLPAPAARARRDARLTVAVPALHEDAPQWLDETFRALADGLRAHGETVEVRPYHDCADADVTVSWGLRASWAALMFAGRRLGARHLVMERGYLGDRERWVSLGWDGLNGRALMPAALDAGERFAAHFGAALKPWCAPRRRGPVLLVGQVPDDASIAQADPPVRLRRWLRQCARILSARGETVVFRPHPLAADLPAPPGARRTEEALDEAGLMRDLERARFVVTCNSNVGVLAALAGVPVVATDAGSMAWPVAAHSVDEAPLTPDRDAWAARLAWCQWSLEELADGSAWAALKALL